ncbi:DsbA family protein [Gynuella sunshinyii]|uniref:DsbA family protein n=1 Tax=Gynuella sunshinyii YC6258 TaxID=1445510 RepID=A0A0C5VC10_9GAMM|nr:DsbA family protein [Gynuella sunshinyii]AJQ96890.1 putative protein-disulfide isomerase [Gynuella sunshinyii YC6258]
MPESKLIYIMDPMCSWCFAFADPLKQLQKQTGLDTEWIMGGLAEDSDESMNTEMQSTIAGYWRKISELTGVTFNHDFWTHNTPRRSTYPSCRAVIAAEKMSKGMSQTMAEAVQQAYFQAAENPSDIDTLIKCAERIGLNPDLFLKTITAGEVETTLQQHLHLVQQWGIQGFPALLMTRQQKAVPLAMGYCSTEELLTHYQKALTLLQ